MKKRSFHPSIFKMNLLFLSLLFLEYGIAVHSTMANTNEISSADNSYRNEQEVTAGDQSNRKEDVQITAKIRQNLVKDKDLSTYAHNIKIITSNGHVTLKGPVRSQQEKQTIERKAKQVAGVEKVNSQIEIASND